MIKLLKFFLLANYTIDINIVKLIISFQKEIIKYFLERNKYYNLPKSKKKSIFWKGII